MKKWIAVFLSLCMLAAYGSAFAETNASVEEQLAQIVQSALDLEELAYEYDAENQSFSIPFSLGCALGQSDVSIYLYDDMISVAADCPLQFDSKSFEKVAVFTTLANNALYYAQFRVDREYGWITCRSCNVIEGVLPTEEEVLTLLYAPLWAMEDYGNGLASICTLGTDPYEAFESCQTSIETA